MPSDAFSGLEPGAFWRHFEALTRIPRATYEEERAVEYVQEWAKQRDMTTRRDDTGNLVVAVPATSGRAAAPTVILQGHLDIVCERDPDSEYDPRAGRIGVVRDGEWLRAHGTTLGADNGVAIAAMLALVEDPQSQHGPLELLMTVQEEIGMAGAAALDPGLITGSVLLNLDSEEDATLTVGCSGGADTILRLDAQREAAAANEIPVRVAISGGRGGHSAGDIAAHRANAIKVLARMLAGLPGIRIATLDGGASRNAIPRESAATILAAEWPRRESIVAAAEPALGAISRDPVRVDVSPHPGVAEAWTSEASARMLDLIAVLPTGPLGMSPDFAGVVETSSSLGVAETHDGRLTLHCLSRSADDFKLQEVTDAIAAAGRLAGAEVERGRVYPGWQPDLDSRALKTAKTVHERLFGAHPHVTLEHGGLEPAVIGARKPGLDMVSLGPRIEGPHAPGERLHIGSAQRFLRFLAALVDELGG